MIARIAILDALSIGPATANDIAVATGRKLTTIRPLISGMKACGALRPARLDKRRDRRGHERTITVWELVA